MTDPAFQAALASAAQAGARRGEAITGYAWRDNHLTVRYAPIVRERPAPPERPKSKRGAAAQGALFE